MLWGRGFDFCVDGHVLTIRIHWKEHR
jgi:hypothetical protein